MTRDEYIIKYVKQIMQTDLSNALSNARSIIVSVNALKYTDGRKLTNKDKTYIIEGIRERLVSTRVIKEAQESAMLAQSIDAIMEVLKPAVNELDNEISRIHEESKSKDAD